ncbi:hypothetical protein Atai01_07930 [Amycolatopsis taiwanensis]|uniref:Uncharacterized protein n=1 Tax=Amycolatopsis taiwanensis TaxID=342230 RepID=A0A9W6QTZ8_9PSEU|nr:hypothetical protein Atai01_07930 [Amycolatopsis taiwanensis]
MLPEYSNSIDAIMASIGSTVNTCAHCRPGGAGIAGGGCSISSPAGISGAGLRAGRFTRTVAMVVIVRVRGRTVAVLAGTCRTAFPGVLRL